MTTSQISTSGPVQALHATLDEQIALHDQLLDVATREEQAIVAGNVEQLTALIEEQEQLIELLATLETDRMTAITAIAAATGLAADESPTLSALAAGLDRAAAEAVLGAGLALRERAVSLAEANASNAALLRGSHALVERWIGYLRGLLGNSLGYSQDGAARGPGNARVIDRSA